MSRTTDPERERARVLLDILRTSAGREVLRVAGHVPGGYLYAAHCDERIGDVMERITRTARSPAVVLVAYDDRRRRAVLHLEPGVDESAEAQTVGGSSTLGMLVDAMHAAGRDTAWNLTVTAWKSAVATGPAKVPAGC